MLNSARSIAVRHQAAFVLSVVSVLLTLACSGGGDPLVGRAMAVYEEKTALSDDHRRYALDIATGTTSPLVRAKVIEAMGDENFQTALRAVRALGDDPPVEATEALQGVFAAKRGALKLQSAVQLARLGDSGALDYLKEQTADPAQLLNVDAVEVVAQNGGQEFLEPILAERMRSESLAERDEVYLALGEVRQPWATAMLVQGLGNERGEDRKQAVTSLGRTGDPEVATEIERFVNTQGLVFATLESLGELGNPRSANAARTMAENDEAAVRAYAGVTLWRLGHAEEARGILDPLVTHEDTTVRTVLAEQLGAVDEAGAQQMLVALAGDLDKGVRMEALRSLAVHARSEIEPALIQATGDSEGEVQQLAVRVLAEVGGPEALGTIEPMLDSENDYVALDASYAVLEIKGRLGTT